MTYYQKMIVAQLKCTPREAVFTEALMRVCQETLDGLTARHFAAVAEACLRDVRQAPDTENVKLAESFGLAVPEVRS